MRPFLFFSHKILCQWAFEGVPVVIQSLRGVLNAILSFKAGWSFHAGLSGNGTVCTKRAIIKQSTLISGGSGIVLRNDFEWVLNVNSTVFDWYCRGKSDGLPFLYLKWQILVVGLQEGLQRGVTLFEERGYKSRFLRYAWRVGKTPLFQKYPRFLIR